MYWYKIWTEFRTGLFGRKGKASIFHMQLKAEVAYPSNISSAYQIWQRRLPEFRNGSWALELMPVEVASLFHKQYPAQGRVAIPLLVQFHSLSSFPEHRGLESLSIQHTPRKSG